MERIRYVAGELMLEFGDEAYAEARRRERKATGDETARDCESRCVGRRPRDMRVRFRRQIDRDRNGKAADVPIQFVCGTLDCGPTNLTEKQVEVADAPAAIIAAANIKWPPQTIGVRILDREGHEVLPDRRLSGD